MSPLKIPAIDNVRMIQNNLFDQFKVSCLGSLKKLKSFKRTFYLKK